MLSFQEGERIFAFPGSSLVLAVDMAMHLISIFIATVLKKCTCISVGILIPIVSHDLQCHILLLQHPTEIAFLNKELQLCGVWKVHYKNVITACSPVKTRS